MRGLSLGSIIILSVLALPVVAGMMWVLPQYNVWSAGLQGQAELRRAQQNRQIRIEEAQADLEAAKLDSLAEIERAKGVAEANKIIAEGLGGPEGYLRYLWINKLGSNQQDVIYIPTEAGIPILEADRLNTSND